MIGRTGERGSWLDDHDRNCGRSCSSHQLWRQQHLWSSHATHVTAWRGSNLLLWHRASPTRYGCNEHLFWCKHAALTLPPREAREVGPIKSRVRSKDQRMWHLKCHFKRFCAFLAEERRENRTAAACFEGLHNWWWNTRLWKPVDRRSSWMEWFWKSVHLGQSS